MVLSGIDSDGGGLNAGKMSIIDNMDLLLYFIRALLSYLVTDTLWRNSKWFLFFFLLHQTTDSELTKFRSLNTARGVAAILGWFIIALAPNTDRLSKNLHEGDDDLVGELELDQMSAAWLEFAHKLLW